jgi:hypothetical protein
MDYFQALGEISCITWNARKSIGAPHPILYPCIQEFVQCPEFTYLQHIANNVPDSFTDIKGVTKSFSSARNAPERVEVPIKTTQLPVPEKRGSSMASNQNLASYKQQRKSRRYPLNQ